MLCQKYDKTFVALLGMQYFNQGSKVLVSLASQNLYKDYYHLEPDYLQFLSSMIIMPWSFKILYGLISDNFPILGTRRKSYLLIGSFGQCIVMILLTVVSLAEEHSTLTVASLLFMGNLCVAFMDVLVDSLMVV
jgi:hypothetical protein